MPRDARHGQMTQQGDPLTAAMVLFCVVERAAYSQFSIAYLWFWLLGMNLRPVLLMLEKLKVVMLDAYIYLDLYWRCLSKVQDYAFLRRRASGF